MLVIVIVLLFKLHKQQNNRPRGRKPDDPETGTPMLPVNNAPGIPDETGVDPVFKTEVSNLEISKLIQKTSCHTIHDGKMKMWKPKTKEDTKKRLSVFVKKIIDPKNLVQQTMIKQELIFMSELEQNPNLLAFIGHVKEEDQISIITENCDGGDLLQFVKLFRGRRGFTNQLIQAPTYNNEGITDSYNKNNRVLDNNLRKLCTFDLLSIAYQMCCGMKSLAGLEFVHRQLSLQNIFITANKTIRIGNFSLARRHGNNAYYRVKNVNLKIPTSHRDPATSEDSRFTEQSDVWSFGVCLYELFTLGDHPFDDLDDMGKFLERVGQLEKPEYCHEEIYDFMMTCWNKNQFERPPFSKCSEFFKGHMERFDVRILEQIEEKLKKASLGQAALADWIRKD